jgi:hypothetical protein
VFFVGKKYGCSKGYPQKNAAHMGSISLWISFALTAGEQMQQKPRRTSSDIGAELENHTVRQGPM